MRWHLLPECGTVPLVFDSERDARAHLRTHYPDARKTDVPWLYRVPSGGWVHCFPANADDDP